MGDSVKSFKDKTELMKRISEELRILISLCFQFMAASGFDFKETGKVPELKRRESINLAPGLIRNNDSEADCLRSDSETSVQYPDVRLNSKMLAKLPQSRCHSPIIVKIPIYNLDTKIQNDGISNTSDKYPISINNSSIFTKIHNSAVVPTNIMKFRYNSEAFIKPNFRHDPKSCTEVKIRTKCEPVKFKLSRYDLNQKVSNVGNYLKRSAKKRKISTKLPQLRCNSPTKTKIPTYNLGASEKKSNFVNHSNTSTKIKFSRNDTKKKMPQSSNDLKTLAELQNRGFNSKTLNSPNSSYNSDILMKVPRCNASKTCNFGHKSKLSTDKAIFRFDSKVTDTKTPDLKYDEGYKNTQENSPKIVNKGKRPLNPIKKYHSRSIDTLNTKIVGCSSISKIVCSDSLRQLLAGQNFELSDIEK